MFFFGWLENLKHFIGFWNENLGENLLENYYFIKSLYFLIKKIDKTRSDFISTYDYNAIIVPVL